MSQEDHSPFNSVLAAQEELGRACRALAHRCEAARGEQEEETCLAAVLDLLASVAGTQRLDPAHRAEVARLAGQGAPESAVLTLIPADATVTGARLSDGTCIAQVILAAPCRAATPQGAHARGADSLAMAWLGAYLRALATGCPPSRGA